MRRLVVTAILLVAVLVPATAAAAPTRTITLVNNTEQTIWPAASPGSTSGQSGWTLKPGAEVSFRVPHDWNARLWGRTGCHFGGGEGDCRTGDCGGRYQCDGWGTIPATLGEFNFDAYKGLDFYDISMVDGSNLPMYATPSGGEADRKVDAEGCLAPTRCTTEVHCPAALRVPRQGGPEVGCISPCARFGTDRYCCRGPFAAACSPATTWPVDYAKVFKRAEPYAYSWSGDDATSVFTCKGSCDYRVTFGLTPPHHGAAVGTTSRPAAARLGLGLHHFPVPAATEARFRSPASDGYAMAGYLRRTDFTAAELAEYAKGTPSHYTVFDLLLKRATASAMYLPKATLEDGRLEADLGKLGHVSLRFVSRHVTFHPLAKECSGGRIRIEHGDFVGRLRFVGEGGYAKVVRRRVPGTLTHEPSQTCDFGNAAKHQQSGGTGGLRVGGNHTIRGGRSSVAFDAERLGPDGHAALTAYASEYRGRMSIYRAVKVQGAAGSVRIEPDLSAATIEPPAPFSGTASFAADPGKQTGTWLGDLSVSFPGRPDVRLAGRRFEGTVLKPGQCSTEETEGSFCFGLTQKGS